MAVTEVEIVRLWDVNCVVKDLLRSLHDLLLASCDLVVKITGCRGSSNFRDGIDRNSPRSHSKDPVVNRQLILLFLQKVFKLSRLSLVSREPALILDFNDFTEALVLGELAIDAHQVLLMLFKDLNEAIHASDGIPPAALFHDSESATKDVTHVTTTSDIGG